jgi:hypothetical protein
METSSNLNPCNEIPLPGGWKKGELIFMAVGRNTGKSMFSSTALQRLWNDLQNRPVEELVLNEQVLSGCRYYTVEPIGGNWKDMELWAFQVFGNPGEIWPKQEFVWPEIPRWVMNNRKFWFRNERDRTMFIMRWSSQ